MDRPIVVNSLLCFIQNFRHHNHVTDLLNGYFSQRVKDVARQVLRDCLKVSRASPLPEDCSLFELLDQVLDMDPAPIFVAADLTALPIVLMGDQSQTQSKNLFNEIHQLRFFIQSALAEQTSKRISSCTLALTDDCKSVDRIKEELHSPTDLSLNSARYSPAMGAVSSSSHSDHAEPSSQATTAASSTSATPKKGHTRRHAPYRLDQAVRKLTDRLEAKKEEPADKLSPKQSFEIKSEELTEDDKSVNMDEVREKSTENTIPTAPLLTPHQMLTNSLLYSATTTTVDPLVLMFKNFANNAKNGNQNADYSGNLQHKFNNQLQDVDGISDADDDDDKMSNESSPTPSDSSNGEKYKYCKEDGDKPFTCSQTNCNKRFANKFLLKKHQFIHTGLRPHICPYCAKRFNRKDNLLRHKKTHLANAALPLDGRRRHHALLSPAPLESLHAFNPLSFLQISSAQRLTEDAED